MSGYLQILRSGNMKDIVANAHGKQFNLDHTTYQYYIPIPVW
jgi:hypothetical protein